MTRLWMIAEDDPTVRSLLEMLMTVWEIDVLMFEDGFQVWKWLDEVERGTCTHPLPEVALLDVKMPGHMGHEVGQRMRAIPATQAIPLIIMTAYHLSKDDRAEIEEAAQPDQMIAKPFPALDDFRDLIEQTIESAKRKHQPEHAFKLSNMWQLER